MITLCVPFSLEFTLKKRISLRPIFYQAIYYSTTIGNERSYFYLTTLAQYSLSDYRGVTFSALLLVAAGFFISLYIKKDNVVA